MRNRMTLRESSTYRDYDKVKVNRMLMLLLHLDTVMTNMMKLLAEEMKVQGLYRFDIKKQINIIMERMKTNLKNDWTTATDNQMDTFSIDDEMFEDMCTRFVGLTDQNTLAVVPKFAVGERVWVFDDDGKTPILTVVESIRVRMDVVHDREGKSKLIDESYYFLRVLTKNMNPTSRTIHRQEEKIYKHIKDLKDENSKVQED